MDTEEVQKININEYLANLKFDLLSPGSPDRKRVNLDEAIEVTKGARSNLSFQKLNFLDIHNLLQNSYGLLDLTSNNRLDQYGSEKIQALQSHLMDLIITIFRIYFGNTDPKDLEIIFKNILELIPKFAAMENNKL